jgi:hypothetical protein
MAPMVNPAISQLRNPVYKANIPIALSLNDKNTSLLANTSLIAAISSGLRYCIFFRFSRSAGKNASIFLNISGFVGIHAFKTAAIFFL